MYKIKWSQFFFYIAELIFLIIILAVLSDISLFSIQTAISTNLKDTNLDWLSENQNSQDEQLKYWKSSWKEGGAPDKRTVQITIAGNDLTVDYSFEIKTDHPVAKYGFSDIPRGNPKDFIEPVFGLILLPSNGLLGPQDFQIGDINIDTQQGLVTAHYLAKTKISNTGTIQLIRNSINDLGLQPKEDRVIVNYSDRSLTSIYPLPTKSEQGQVYFEAAAPEIVKVMAFESYVPKITAETVNTIFSRQELLQKVGDLLDGVPFVSDILGAILEVLPLLMFLKLISAWPGKKPRILMLLCEVLLVMLTFHFTFYLVGAVANLFFSAVNLFNLTGSLNNFILDIYSSFGISTYNYTGFYFLGIHTVQTIIMGVLIPAILIRRSAEWNSFKSRGFHPPENPLGKHRQPPVPGRRFSWLLLLTVLVLLFAVAFPFLLDRIIADNDLLVNTENLSAVQFFALAFGITGLLELIVLRALYGHLDGRPQSPSAIPAAFWLLVAGNIIWSFTLVMITKFERYSESPYTGWGWFAYSAIVGALLVYGFVRMVYTLCVQAGWVKELSRVTNGIMLLLSFITAIPMRLLFANANTSADYYEVLRLASQLDNLIGMVFLAGLVWYFYEEGKKVKEGGPSLKPLTLAVGLIAAAMVLYRPSASWFYIPLTFLLGYRFLTYFIQPAEYWDKLAPLFGRVFKERNAFLEQIVSLNTAERSYQGLYKSWSQKMSDGEKTYAEFQAKVDGLRAELDQSNERAKVQNRPIKDIALAFGPYETAWGNGVHGAFWAAIFALPWMTIWLVNFMTGEVVSSPYPLWSFFSDLLSLILSWVGIGFVFGYFYPYLRGKDGLQKGLWLWLVAVLPAIPLALINNASAIAWQGFLFWVLQIFIHCMLLGMIAFDYMTLRQGYRDWQMLFELHGIPYVGVSISSILLAVGTAITALFQSQTQDIVKAALTFILPNADKFIKFP